MNLYTQQLLTHHNQGEWDHDPTQELVGDGLLFQRVPDALIVAEEASFERAVLRGNDEKRKPH